MNKLVYLCVALGMISLVLTFFAVRVPVTTWWWDTTRTLPEVVIFVSQDAGLGTRVAYYYFDAGDQQKEYDIARANRLYDQVLAIDPTIAWSWYQKGRIAFLHKDYDEALVFLDQFQELSDIPRPRAIYLKGVILGFMGKPEAALESLQEYYTLDDQSWYIYNNLAWVYFQLGRFTDMDDISAAGLVIHPDNPWLLMNQSLALYNLGLPEEAKKYINRSYNKAMQLTEADWSTTYPGNDPLIASMGLVELLTIVEANRDLINKAE
jgi:tetratricopeptide (TPR) repeat protein